MNLKLITAPAAEPVDLTLAKAHCRITDSQQDALVTLAIESARQAVDGQNGVLGRALITQTWELVLDCFPSEFIRIPLPPLQSVVSIKYQDPDGIEQTLDPGRYLVDTASQPGGVVVDADGWPEIDDTANAVRIRFIAGYGAAAADVPAPIRSAILLQVGDLIENRQTQQKDALVMNPAAESLLFPYRMLTP